MSLLRLGVGRRRRPPAENKWLNTVFRNTVGGSASWPGGAIVDRNDDNNETITIIAGLPNYPSPIAVGSSYDHGRSGTAASGAHTNSTPVNAGNNPLLGGASNWTSGLGLGYTRDCDPGEYDLRLALGRNNSNETRDEIIFVFDGTYEVLGNISSSLSGMHYWASGLSVTVNQTVVAPDLGVWKCTTAGATGSTPPSGGVPGNTFVDGTVTWTRTNRSALLAVKATNTSTTTVVDQRGVVHAAADWETNTVPVSVTISGDYGAAFTVIRSYNAAPWVRTVGIKAKGTPLFDALLFSDTNENVSAAPVLYADQLENYRQFRLKFSSGAQAPANFSIGGTLAPYLKVVKYGSRVYLACTGTPLPSSMAGAQTLSITQTDGAASHTTNFTCTVLSSQSKPGSGIYSQITTQNWINIKTIDDVLTADLWPGYQGQPFASDVLAANGSDLVSQLNAITPTGSSWHRIRLGNAVYTGTANISKAMGSGGILIEPDAGVAKSQARYDIASTFKVSGIHIRNLHIVADNALDPYTIRGNDPGPLGINNSGEFNKIKVENCNIGVLYLPGTTPQNDLSRSANPFMIRHGASLEIIDCDFYGTGTIALEISGVRAQSIQRNSFRCSAGDIYGGSNAYFATSTQNVFGDNHVYVKIKDCAAYADPDWEGFSNDVHSDFVQIRTFHQNMPDWYPNAVKHGSKNTSDPELIWKVGDKALSADSVPSAIYEVVAVTGDGMTGSTPPQGTGSSIVDGGITWKYVQEYTTASDVYMNIEGCSVLCNVPIANGPHRQFVIDSNGGSGGVHPNHGSHKCGLHLSVLNNLYGGPSSYGVTSRSPGNVFAEFNTFPGPADIYPGANFLNAELRSERGAVRAYNNYVRNASSGKFAIVDNERILVWSSSAVSPNKPIEVFPDAGIILSANGRYLYPSFNESLYTSVADFANAFRGRFLDTSYPSAGIR